VTEAVDGEQGVIALETDRFDLIVSDIHMPNINGLEFLSFIKNHAENKFAKVVILTTEISIEKKQEAKALGASGFIVKPFDPAVLVKTIEKLMS